MIENTYILARKVKKKKVLSSPQLWMPQVCHLWL